MEKFSLPIISAIIERQKDGETEILVQTRWKPEEDPVYTGCLEIPAGKIREFENVYDALNREVKEETGLKITSIFPDIKTKTHSPKDDGSFAFQPFCCQQQTKGGRPWIGFVFICNVEDKTPLKEGDNTRDIRWIKKSELKRIFEETPEKIFTLQLGVLDYYFNKS
ncbi:MAG: NUDIX hydrolase [Patescibacteria group bacterium]|jgi:8-oxo-dGTP pyrophosphatase MutT (NUDIX family)